MKTPKNQDDIFIDVDKFIERPVQETSDYAPSPNNKIAIDDQLDPKSEKNFTRALTGNENSPKKSLLEDYEQFSRQVTVGDSKKNYKESFTLEPI